jgi:2-polyprenyl-6-methoxyphenol hydroxylase-like FAD-dependent oxidoreductase
MLPRMLILFLHYPLLTVSTDHAQGGAQGLEDGIALGLVFAGVSAPVEIPIRLKLYEKIRRNRAASIQILSNTGYDEETPGELDLFLEGGSAPGRWSPFPFPARLRCDLESSR